MSQYFEVESYMERGEKIGYRCFNPELNFALGVHNCQQCFGVASFRGHLTEQRNPFFLQ